MNNHEEDTCLAIFERFQTHPSILKHKSSVNSTINLSYKKITAEEMLKQLQNIDLKKGSPQETIPTKILKSNADTFAFTLQSFLINLLRKVASQMI